MRACSGHCAMHHECPCADKLARHPHGGVANTPGTQISTKVEPGSQLRQALAAINVTEHGDVVDLGPLGALRRQLVAARELESMRRR
jgi:hypothetical protein